MGTCFIVVCAGGNTDRKGQKRVVSVCVNRRDLCRLIGIGLTAGFTLSVTPYGAEAAAKSLEYQEFRGMSKKDESSLPGFRKVAPGVEVQDIKVGSGSEGEAVQRGSRVAVQYVLRRSNGYFVDASYGFDRFETYNFTAGVGEVIQGFDDAIAGMKEGDRRRFIVNPAVGYTKGTSKGSPGPIPPEWGNRRALATHAQEPLIFEVQIVRVRPPKG